MMLKSRTATTSAARRSVLSAPVARPVAPCRFKEDNSADKLRNEADKKVSQPLKEVGQQASNNLKRDRFDTSSSSQFDAQYKVNPAIPAFTRRREVFASRLAMFGFFAACFWEWQLPNHPNICEQVSGFFNLAGINLGPGFSLLLILAMVGYNTLGAVVPGSPTFDEANQQDVAKRPDGPPQVGVDASDTKSAFGFREFGFNKSNEIFAGRAAMFGFVAALIGQLVQGGLTGPGPLAQVANYAGIIPNDSYYASMPGIFWISVIGAIALSFFTGNMNNYQNEKDVY